MSREDCPVCGSTDVETLSFLVGFVEVYKQYWCKACEWSLYVEKPKEEKDENFQL